MEQQNYKNHIRYYAPHHFAFYSAAMIVLGLCIYFIATDGPNRTIWSMMTALLVLIIWVAVMLRQHYALSNQNRIVRLEMRLRYFELTGKRLEPIEQQLSFGQLAALRFAGDDEILALMERALKEHLSADAIKKSVQHWVPDEMRV